MDNHVNNAREVIFLDPVCSHNIWGGSRLGDEFGYGVEGSDIGECWGISAHPNGDGTVRGGAYDGKKLSELWSGHPELFGNLQYDRYPLLIKIIDAQDDLSIQVHPDDDYAQKNENGSLGKTECWYIMDCAENGTLVAGHNARSREELSRMVEEGRWKELIREIPIKKGDFIQIEPGTVHAIKAHTLILETQQNSDITYRLYDYDRVQANGKKRELHIQKSLDVITVDGEEQPNVESTCGLPENVLNQIYSCEKYDIFKLTVNKEAVIDQKYPFLAASVLEGEGQIDGSPLGKGDHFIVPAGYGEMRISGNMSLILSTVEE